MRRVALSLGACLATCMTVGVAVPALASPAPSRMLVTAQEWTLMLSRGRVPGGTLTVQYHNRGQDAHDLNIRRAGVHGRLTGSTQHVSLTSSGGLSHATWTLRRGSYYLYCSLPGHAHAGMHGWLIVR